VQLRGLVLLLDIRRDPSDDDRAMLDFLARLEIPTLVALTKADKINKAAVQTRVSDVSLALSLDAEQIIPFSVVTGQGRTELLEAIMQLVAPASQISTQ
jgi:GTP-binding protein